MASPATIRASRVAPSYVAPPRDLRRRLQVQHGEEIAFRHVRLSCGGTVLSEAYNWYVPGRLTPEMNVRLEATDTPFGTVAAPVHFHRERLRSSYSASGPCPGPTILTHRARLVLPDGRPLAMLVECYLPENLTAGS
jgi:chorismate-pyruvate lyase